jgi:hypothetical protein
MVSPYPAAAVAVDEGWTPYRTDERASRRLTTESEYLCVRVEGEKKETREIGNGRYGKTWKGKEEFKKGLACWAGPKDGSLACSRLESSWRGRVFGGVQR